MAVFLKEHLLKCLKVYLNLILSPENTKIYPAHEYTENNLKWALTLDSNDISIIKRLRLIQISVRKGMPSLPSTISEERKTNLFLRAKCRRIYNSKKAQR